MHTGYERVERCLITFIFVRNPVHCWVRYMPVFAHVCISFKIGSPKNAVINDNHIKIDTEKLYQVGVYFILLRCVPSMIRNYVFRLNVNL